jgi:hypothetical protein
MLFSRNSFFRQNSEILKEKRNLLEAVLNDATIENVSLFLDAYDYFCDFPEDFDGATIVKDLDTIRDLDASAMVHDYEYLVNKSWKNPIIKTIVDINYAQNMEKLGNSSITAYTRCILLILSTPFYYLIKLFK